MLGCSSLLLDRNPVIICALNSQPPRVSAMAGSLTSAQPPTLIFLFVVQSREGIPAPGKQEEMYFFRMNVSFNHPRLNITSRSKFTPHRPMKRSSGLTAVLKD